MPPSPQLELKFKATHGGARKGAGRPRKPGAPPRHVKRARVTSRTPVHITVKLRPGLATLRSHGRLKAFAHAVRCASRHGLRIQHFSLQKNHAHLIGEAENNPNISKGMQSLAVSLARALNQTMGFQGKPRKGTVFLGRYHLHVLRTPTEVKRALRYVLANAAKHERIQPLLDRFSSAHHFEHWTQAFGREVERRLRKGLRLEPPWKKRLGEFLSPPRSWLLREGWMRARA